MGITNPPADAPLLKTREALKMQRTYAAGTNYTSLGIRCSTVKITVSYIIKD